MRKDQYSRARILALATLAVFASVAPAASADTSGPVWTCRASAAYVEINPLLAGQRVEPVLANGFPNRDRPDTEMCATTTAGIDSVSIPAGSGQNALLTLEAASARTKIAPQIAAARDQTASADAGIAKKVRVNVAGLVIEAEVITASATGTCNAGKPQLAGSSRIVSLSILGQPAIVIPNAGQGAVDINLGVARVRLNQQEVVTDSAGNQTLTQRAAHIEVLPVAGGQPVARVVLGEVKVDFHGQVCKAAPPPPTCPAGFDAQDPAARPLVCLKTVTETQTVTQPVPTPCGPGTTANAEGICVVAPVTCPSGSLHDPATNNCIVVRERPCPPGSTVDPASGVCVVRVVQNTGSSSGVNGRIGSSTGQPATCGRIQMRFVRGGGRTLTSRFGTRVVTRGRLVTCGSNPRPIVGARVDVVHILPDGRRLRKTGLRSRGAGRLTLILPMDLRSRRIEYGYRPDLRSKRVTSRATLRLTVRNRNGRVMR